jgi:hypothetical protein
MKATIRSNLTSDGWLLEPRQRQFLLANLKKGPAIDRDELAQYALDLVIRGLKLDISALCDEKMKRWREGNGTYNKPAANETYLY